MSEALVQPLPVAEPGSALITVRIGWRNLWRNRRRTWLTAGGIAFGVWLVVSVMALQLEQYAVMAENATALMAGQVQIQTRDYLDDNRFEDTIEGAAGLVARLGSEPGVVAVAPRVEAFALASREERSFGAQVLGVDVTAELEAVRFLRMIVEGRTLAGGNEAVIGTVLARNLGAGVGDELVVLGAGREGDLAAMVVQVVGLLQTGMADLDRVLMVAPLEAVQEGFGLEDEVHSIVIRTRELEAAPRVVRHLRAALPEELAVRPWNEVLPEVEQGIEVDRIFGYIMYGIILGLVVFSVVNSFIMTVFERTQEFGMLLAIGMKPARIIAMLLWEAFFVSILGIALGLALALALTVYLMNVGIYLGEAMEAYASQFYMPDRMYPGLSAAALLTAPVVILIGTQLAAFLPALRIRHLRPVEALRSE